MNILSNAYHFEITKGLIIAWGLGLKNVPGRLIKDAIQSFIEERAQGYKPTPGEYAEHCRRYQAAENKTLRLETENDEEPYQLTHDEASKAYGCIIQKLDQKKRKGEIKPPQKETENPLEIYEYCNREGEPVYYICYGHIGFDRFRSEVLNQFYSCVRVVNHSWGRDKKHPQRDSNGNIERIVSYFSKSGEHKGCAVTIGRL